MRKKNFKNWLLPFVLAGCALFTSCGEDEETLVPIEISTACRFSPFPQGDGEYDQKIGAFQEEHQVYMIYKDIESRDINKAWHTVSGTELYEFTMIEPENIGFYYDFYEENLFSHFPSKYLQFLPMYLYALEELKITDPIYYKADGLDYLCIAGTPEELEANKRQIRQCLTWELIDKLIELDSITVPVEFTAGINYSTTVDTWYPENWNYYANLGFVFSMTQDFSMETNPYYWETPEDDFIYYLRSAIGYTEEEFFERYPADTYPLVKQRYDIVTSYMKETHGIDLKKIAAK